MIDQYFTPAAIAKNSFDTLNKENVNVVADFTVGNGSLLYALPFRATQILGLDIDQRIIVKLKRKNPKWDLHKGDFLAPSPTIKKWLKKWENNVDLIVLNPPFSCRGGAKIDISIDNKTLSCRTALAFIVNSLKYLKPSGELIAILPLSSYKSEADKIILDYLRDEWQLKFGKRFGASAFENCSPSSIILSICRKSEDSIINTKATIPQIVKPLYKPNIEIIRGSTQIYKTLQIGKYKVIHTTNLRNQKLLKKDFRYTNSSSKYVHGFLLLIPRVGNPSKDKIVTVSLSKKYVLSDCIIGLRGTNDVQTTYLYKLIIDNWENFSQLYQSTCAPYITISQVQNFFKEYHFTSTILNSFLPVSSNSNLQIFSEENALAV